ncbi:MAG: DsbA family protein [Parasphingopyxis sp.]|nr:DsbA family protein [Sphingomonadales bacterium]
MPGNRWIIGVAVAALAGLAAFLLLRDGGADGEDVDLPAGLEREDLELVIRDYILENPEIIPEAMERLQRRGQAERVSAVRTELETPFAGAWAGNEDGAVTVVEFFDYACGYCRESLEDVRRLIAEQEDVKVVFRELPVLGAESREAARVSLAAARQGEFFDFHRAMYAAGRPGEASIAAAGRRAGLDAARVRRDIADPAFDAELAGNLQLAQQLQLSGTPVFIVGDQILEGAVGYDRLLEAVEEARRQGG